jgi:predicted O-methyltransferase YrrM
LLNLDKLKRIIKGVPFLNRGLEIRFRYRRATSYHRKKLKIARKWALLQTEISNYYYEITPRNRKDLAFLISCLLKKSLNEIEGYLTEIENDLAIQNILNDYRKSNKKMRDSNMKLGRRIGWYAIVRATKPRIVLETGVHHGVGSLVLTAALKMNASEGFSGKYIGTDISAAAGLLLTEPYSSFGEILYGDSIESLKSLDTDEIDLFINDSDHSGEYEYREYLTITDKLSPRGIILGDNSHATDSLRKYSEENDRRFVFFEEDPFEHFYSGAGIGISLPK